MAPRNKARVLGSFLPTCPCSRAPHAATHTTMAVWAHSTPCPAGLCWVGTESEASLAAYQSSFGIRSLGRS